MNKILYLLFLSFFLLNACQKEFNVDSPGGSSGTGGSGGSGGTGTTSLEKTSLILITSEEVGTNGFSEYYLNAFDTTKVLKWRRQVSALPGDPSATYGGGYLFYTYFNYQGPNMISVLACINPSNGNFKWADTSATDVFYSPVLRGDTIYCSIGRNSTSSYIAAFSATTGTKYWEKNVNEPNLVVRLQLDGNTIFFGTGGTYNAIPNVGAFDLVSRNVKWKTASIDPLSGNTLTQMIINGSFLQVLNVSKEIQTMDKNTGAIVWKKSLLPSGYFDQPLFANSLLYSRSADSGLYAFNSQTGAQVWRAANLTSSSIYSSSMTGNPFIDDKTIYITGKPYGSVFFYVKSVDAITGNLNWERSSGFSFEHPVAVGSNLYLNRPGYYTSSPNSKLLIMNAANGQVKDSIIFNGDFAASVKFITASGTLISSN